jgi:hypothetical protein
MTATARTTTPQHAVLGYYSSRHSQLVPFTTLTSDLEDLLPLFSASSRSEANKRCVRSALGCKCSISVTQQLIQGFLWRNPRGKGQGNNGVMKRFAYLFATRYQPVYQHRLSLLRVVQLLSELLVLAKEYHDGRKFLLLNVQNNKMTPPKKNLPQKENRDDNYDKPRTYLFLDLLRAYFFPFRELPLLRGSRAG